MAQQINFKTGQEENLPQEKTPGTVYFTVDENNKIGKIYFDHSAETRVNIVPERLDCGSWDVIALDSCCFVAGTQVLCDFEGNTKSIETIKSGDEVLSYNIVTKQFYPVVVQKLIVNTNTTHLAFVLLENGSSLEMNAYHPIYTDDGFHSLTNYNDYKTLAIGDNVKCFDGYCKILDIVETNTNKPVTTYNLAVRDYNEHYDDDTNDTFIVNNCVVHNAECST